MDTELPKGIASELERDRRDRRRRASRLRVAAADKLYTVLELTETGFVIEAPEPPHLRGFVDILEGDERIARRLVVCVSSGDGLVGYEFKRESAIGGVPADHVASRIAGLIEARRD
ncbi:MAG: hypothetical protein AAFR79_17565 [Pseudomonadota bacterium]